MDPEILARQRRANLRQSLVLIAAIAAVVGLCGLILAGLPGLVAMATATVATLLLLPQAPPDLVLRAAGARRIPPAEAPEIHQMLAELARRAELERVPALYLLPSPVLAAFTVGGRRAAAVAVTAGLLRGVSWRELVAVLAHEIAHVQNDDMSIMALADAAARFTRVLSLVGLFLLLFNLPFAVAAREAVPWALVLLLLVAPTLIALLQLALSRAREFNADLVAAELTGDPDALASALVRIDRPWHQLWGRVFFPAKRDAVPSLLRTHPSTEERLARLRALRPIRRHAPFPGIPAFRLPEAATLTPRRRRFF